jgi:FixJ family two-component response regulator
MARAENDTTVHHGRKKRVMLVDDEIDVISVLKIVLEDNGFQVDPFEDPLH